MRSQRALPAPTLEQAHVITPLPGAPAPPVPYAPARSQPPPDAPLGAGTIDGYAATGASRDVGAPTLMDEAPRRRASTSSAETAMLTSEPPKKSSSAGVVALLGVVALGVLGTGAYFGLRAMTSGPSTPTAPTSTASAPVATNATTTSVQASESIDPASSNASTSVAKTSIALHVAAIDAVVEKKVGNDWVQVCDKAPCDVMVDPGAVVSLRATKSGVAGAEKKVLADHEQTIALAPPVFTKPKPSGSVQTMCEVIEGDLKILRPCKAPP
jgi:hypothetical protein